MSSARRRRRISRRAAALSSVVGIGAITFLGLAVLLQGAASGPLDLMVVQALQSLEHPVMLWTMVAVSALGYEPLNVIVTALPVAAFWLRGLRREAVYLLLALGAGLIASLAKLYVSRPRPDPEVVRVFTQLLDYSYPSGHVVTYTSFFGFLAFLLYVHFGPTLWRTALLVGLMIVIGLVGVSRVYLGQHWPSDVVGGYALGSVYLIGLIQLYRADASRAEPGG